MKQLLLRVPEDLHKRLAARAGREGRSINAVATELIELMINADPGDRRARLRAKAAALGIWRPVAAPEKRLTPEEREKAIESTRGIGPIVDAYLEESRGRV
jgi:plasmid stability protein